jgi:hypothetical protein
VDRSQKHRSRTTAAPAFTPRTFPIRIVSLPLDRRDNARAATSPKNLSLVLTDPEKLFTQEIKQEFTQLQAA